MTARLLTAVALLCTLGFASRARADVHVIASAHYQLHYEGARVDAEEASRVLEAAWPSFKAFFGAEPKLASEQKLTVRYYTSREAWAAGILRDGTKPPGSAGGYYWPGTKTAHLYRQPTQYFTRALLIHEAAHQFHFLGRTRNKGPKAGWYTEGVAEYLSWHQWDGRKLVLGVIPGVSLKDYPAVALQELEAPGFDLAAAVGGNAKVSRPLGWAIFRFLATGKAGKPLPGFATFCRKMDQGGQPFALFKKAFGRPAKLFPRFLSWLREHQSPWAQVFNQWEQIGPQAFRGHAGVVSACRLKEPATTLGAVVELPARKRRWRAGLLLHWTSADDYTVALVTKGGWIAIDRRLQGRWQRLARDRWPASESSTSRALRATREGPKVAFFLDGRRIGAWALPGSALGLALDNGDLRFRDVDFR